MGKSKENVQVGVRIRPLNSSELDRKDKFVWRYRSTSISEIEKDSDESGEHTTNTDESSLILMQSKLGTTDDKQEKKHTFHGEYDKVFGPEISTKNVFKGKFIFLYFTIIVIIIFIC